MRCASFADASGDAVDVVDDAVDDAAVGPAAAVVTPCAAAPACMKPTTPKHATAENESALPNARERRSARRT